MKRAATTTALLLVLALTAESAARADDAACVDASERALTLRRDGKLRDALKQLAVCGAPGCPREITDECSRRARVIDDAMPTLIIAATDAAGNDIVAAKVTVDGTLTSEKLDGHQLTLDPGAHVVKLEGSGVVVEKTLVLRESEKGRRENFVLAKPVVKPPPPPPPADAPTFDTPRKLALVAGGVGVVGIALGATFGLLANGKKSSEQSACSASSCPDHAGAQSDYSSAHDLATVSTIAFIAGAAFLATGAVLWFTAPKSTTKSASTHAAFDTPLRWAF